MTSSTLLAPPAHEAARRDEAATAPRTLIELSQARLGYGDRVIVPCVDLVVREGDFLAIVGPNGSGKTTILRAILGTLAPLAGTVRAPDRCGYSPQRRALDPIFPFTVEEVVAMGLVSEIGPLRRIDRHGRARVRRALVACGAAHLAERAFRDLSGGQQQRTLVARALVTEPEVLVLDEPTNDLDLTGEHEIMELISELNRGGRTIVMVSHLLNVIAHYATRVAILSRGMLETGPATEVLTSPRLTRLYGIEVVTEEIAGRRAIVPRPEARVSAGGAGRGRAAHRVARRRHASIDQSLGQATHLAASFLLGVLPRELQDELGTRIGNVVARLLRTRRPVVVERLKAILPELPSPGNAPTAGSTFERDCRAAVREAVYRFAMKAQTAIRGTGA